MVAAAGISTPLQGRFRLVNQLGQTTLDRTLGQRFAAEIDSRGDAGGAVLPMHRNSAEQANDGLIAHERSLQTILAARRVLS